MFYKSQQALVALPLPHVVQLPIRPHPVTLMLSRYLTAQQMPTNSASSPAQFSCPVEQPPSIYSNSTISWPVQGRAGTTLRLITYMLSAHSHPPPHKPPTYHPTLHPLPYHYQHTLHLRRRTFIWQNKCALRIIIHDWLCLGDSH